jgi:hypothetical protein
LVEVELGDLKKVGKDIAEIVSKRVGGEVQLKGKHLLVPDTIKGKH